MNYIYKYSYIFLLLSASLISCVDQKKFENIGIHSSPRVEYAPNMHYAVSYEPLKQVTDPDQGSFFASDDDGYGEYYNSNPLNPHEMTMRDPAPNTIRRGAPLPYTLPKDCLAVAARIMQNPLKMTPEVIEEGKILYTKFCSHCHGETGQGDGPVNSAFKGVANLTSGSIKEATPGHIFHVISKGKGRMGAHESQLNQEERWKIVTYVKENLQKAEAQQ